MFEKFSLIVKIKLKKVGYGCGFKLVFLRMFYYYFEFFEFDFIGLLCS